jgi:hypothetical protein
MSAMQQAPNANRPRERGSLHLIPDARKCDTNHSVRARYFYGMLLEAPDLETDQMYHVDVARRHAAELHGHGTVCGLKVNDTRCAWEVEVEPGVAIDCQGRVIRVERRLVLDIEKLAKEAFRERVRKHNRELGEPAVQQHKDPDDCDCWDPTLDLWVGICYEECPERPVQSLGADGCCGSECEPSRVREGFCAYVTAEKPERHPSITDGLHCDHDDIREHLCHWIVEKCRTCAIDPCAKEHHCLTLAEVRVSRDGEVHRPDNCSHRSLVLSTSVLAALVLELHEEWRR